VVGVTFEDSDSAPVPKFLNPGPAILQIWESDSCSDSGYNHRSKRNLPMFLPEKWPQQTPATAEMGKWLRLRIRFFTNFWLRCGSGSERKTQNPAGVDSGNPDPVPPLTTIHWTNILEMILSLFIWKRFCLPGSLTLMVTVVRHTSKPKWMPLDTYRPSWLTSCISMTW